MAGDPSWQWRILKGYRESGPTASHVRVSSRFRGKSKPLNNWNSTISVAQCCCRTTLQPIIYDRRSFNCGWNVSNTHHAPQAPSHFTTFLEIWTISCKEKNPMRQLVQTAFNVLIDSRSHNFVSNVINELHIKWRKCIDNNGIRMKNM